MHMYRVCTYVRMYVCAYLLYCMYVQRGHVLITGHECVCVWLLYVFCVYACVRLYGFCVHSVDLVFLCVCRCVRVCPVFPVCVQVHECMRLCLCISCEYTHTLKNWCKCWHSGVHPISSSAHLTPLTLSYSLLSRKCIDEYSVRHCLLEWNSCSRFLYCCAGTCVHFILTHAHTHVRTCMYVCAYLHMHAYVSALVVAMCICVYSYLRLAVQCQLMRSSYTLLFPCCFLHNTARFVCTFLLFYTHRYTYMVLVSHIHIYNVWLC